MGENNPIDTSVEGRQEELLPGCIRYEELESVAARGLQVGALLWKSSWESSSA